MKNLLILSCLAFSVIALCSCQSQQPTASQAERQASAPSKPQSDPKVVEEIRLVLQQHDKALGEKNLDGVMDTFVPGSNTVLLGTGNAERFVGVENIRNAYIEIFKDYDPNTLDINCDWKTGEQLGDMAWLAATCQAKDSLKNKARKYGLNVTAAVVKNDGKWRFSMLHMSNLTGPPTP
jgi:ketosteroid isomerase-like protein